MSPDFFGDCGRILAQEPGNILKGSALIQFVFDIDTVFKGKVFLVARNIFTLVTKNTLPLKTVSISKTN